ncbi:MAG: hypothetical protein Terrestrivirus1_130 [Terrestrivirus sp.]|uniref:Endonuclease/exonuclease/phosphatase domain-containing protein n=1 Tax=Terrestrivirus sp. TaxID=2487775 RepID=A0A3G4ZKA0_9VIRU|nr:MAG: hypothetical protein Terrestrivirus1_130 [Terrestrivirus sp.]
MSHQLSVLSFNIDTNISRTEDGFATASHPNWRVSKRMPNIIRVVRSINPDIVQFQEGRTVILSNGQIDSVTPLVNEFKEDYHVITASYNPTSRSFVYISCFSKKKFKLLSHSSYYLTETPLECKTPEQMKEYEGKSDEELISLKKKWTQLNGFEEFEKSVLWAELECLETGSHIISVNAHLGIGDKHRLYASEKINKLVSYLGERTPNIVMTGDFNTFPDWKGPEQLEIIKSSDLSSKIRYIPDYRNCVNYDDAKEMVHQSTFHFYPYDYGVNEKLDFVRTEMAQIQACVRENNIEETKNKINSVFKKCCNDDSSYPLGGQLDHIFYNNLKPVYDYAFLVPSWNNDIKSVPFESSPLKQIICDNLDQNSPVFASDHQPLLGLFEY